jgi:methionyl-tRNA formyltransferase
LVNGDTTIGATALLASDRYDEGAIIAQQALTISYPIKIAAAIALLSPLYATLAAKLVDTIVQGRPIEARQQDHSQATYSLWRDDADYRTDWNRSSSWIRRFVDAVGFPYRGASALLDGRVVRILEAEEWPDVKVENRCPGKVVFVEDGLPVVVCGTGLLRLLAVVDDESGASLLPLKKFRSRFL